MKKPAALDEGLESVRGSPHDRLTHTSTESALALFICAARGRHTTTHAYKLQNQDHKSESAIVIVDLLLIDLRRFWKVRNRSIA